MLSSVADGLAALAEARDQELAASIGQVVALAHLCDTYQVNENTLMEGAERWVRGGADGAPDVGEFLACEVAALLGISVASASIRMARVLNLRHRHPTLWQLVLCGGAPFWQAATVADEAASAGLSLAACLEVDRHCAIALRVQPWARVRGQVGEWILRADPRAAIERRARQSAARHVEVGSIVDGHVDLYGRLDAADGILFDQALDHVAGQLSDQGGDHRMRRAAAVGVLARTVFGQEPLPDNPQTSTRKADLVVRIDAADITDPTGVADVDRWGPMLTDQLGRLLSGCRVRVRPVVDPRTIEPVDGYDIPERMRIVLGLRNPACVFPYSHTPADRCDVDHTIPYTEGVAGQTRLDNLAPLSRRAHRAKTFGGWKLEQPQPGVLAWTSPQGYEYLVGPNGTVQVRRPEPPPYAWWLREPPEPEDPPERIVESDEPIDPPPRQALLVS